MRDKYKGEVDVRKIDVDREDSRELSSRYRIQVIPTFVFIDRTGAEVERINGALSEGELEGKIKNLLLK